MCAAWLGRTVGLRNAERATPSDGTYQLAVCNVLDPLPKLRHDAIAVPTRRHGRARKALVAVVGVLPYIALQLKAVTLSFEHVVGPQVAPPLQWSQRQ